MSRNHLPSSTCSHRPSGSSGVFTRTRGGDTGLATKCGSPSFCHFCGLRPKINLNIFDNVRVSVCLVEADSGCGQVRGGDRLREQVPEADLALHSLSAENALDRKRSRRWNATGRPCLAVRGRGGLELSRALRITPPRRPKSERWRLSPCVPGRAGAGTLVPLLPTHSLSLCEQLQIQVERVTSS